MSCSGCSNNKTKDGLPGGCQNNGACGVGGCGDMLSTYDWLSNVYYVDDEVRKNLVEVKFKATRKEIFQNPFSLDLNIGDMVAVETNTGGHDVGTVSATGEIVKLQLKKKNITDASGLFKVLRRATEQDLNLWEEAKNREYPGMLKCRQIAKSLGLVMKISDLEFQGDNKKVTVYYTADGRVDFRELIKHLAQTFNVKIEMKQIGLRQEAGRIGGIGDCGRELCCSTWLTDFNSVPTVAAKYQNLFLNPLKLAGQCGRLKCCLNYELDTYMEALEDFPREDAKLNTEKGKMRIIKTDILKKIVWFIYEEERHPTYIPVSVEEANKLIKANKKGVVHPPLETLIEGQQLTQVGTNYAANETDASSNHPAKGELHFKDAVGEDNIDRFDQKRPKRKKKRKPSGRNKKRTAPNTDGDNQNTANSNKNPKRPPSNQKQATDQRKKPNPQGNQPKDQKGPKRKPRPKKGEGNQNSPKSS